MPGCFALQILATGKLDWNRGLVSERLPFFLFPDVQEGITLIKFLVIFDEQGLKYSPNSVYDVLDQYGS